MLPRGSAADCWTATQLTALYRDITAHNFDLPSYTITRSDGWSQTKPFLVETGNFVYLEEGETLELRMPLTPFGVNSIKITDMYYY